MIKQLHHIAVIASSEKGIDFYKDLGFVEDNRINRDYDQIVWLSGFDIKLEVFIDNKHPDRLTNPEALGLRHLAFEVDDVDNEWNTLSKYNPEPIRIKENNKKVFFVKDPDGLPIEIRD